MKLKKNQSVIEGAKKITRDTVFCSRLGGWLFTLGTVIFPATILTALAFSRKPEVVTVTVQEGLAPYQQIRASDITLVHTAARPGTARSVDAVTGRSALRPMKKGDLVDVQSLSSSGTALKWDETEAISVQIRPLPKGAFVILPQKITLLGASKTATPVSFRIEAILLAVDDSKDTWARIAVPKETVGALLDAVSIADFYVVQDLR